MSADICASRDDAQPHIAMNGRCVFCGTPRYCPTCGGLGDIPLAPCIGTGNAFDMAFHGSGVSWARRLPKMER